VFAIVGECIDMGIAREKFGCKEKVFDDAVGIMEVLRFGRRYRFSGTFSGTAFKRLACVAGSREYNTIFPKLYKL
jgi:hypothetical protein